MGPPTLLSMPSSRENAFSIGMKSGLYGGRKRKVAPTASIVCFTAARLWLQRLCMTTMSPGRSSGTKTCIT